MAVIAALVAASFIRAGSVVGGLTVRIDSQGVTALVTTTEIENSLLEEFPGLTSSRVKDVIARVFYESKDFYVDCYGRCFPSRRNARCDVPVASGHFRQSLKGDPVQLDIAQMSNDTLKSAYDIVKVWMLAKFMDGPAGYSKLYDQIYVDENGDLILQPRLGYHEVVIGSAENLEKKFSNLKIFYSKGLPHAGYDAYSRVSVKFDGQVVCTKRKQINKQQ